MRKLKKGEEMMLKVEEITKKFHGLVAVNNLSFQVNQGEVVGLVGQNGAGKSTTFKMILNFLTPDAGEITVNSQKTNEKILDMIGYLPEERGLYMDMTIREQVLYFASLHNYDLSKAKVEIPKWLDKLSVKGSEKTLVKNLSKGNQQKVQLITALIHHPKLVILDEPFSGLDPVNIGLLIEVVNQLKQEGTAIIFSSHNMKNVSKVSDKLLMLVNGSRKLYGPISQIKSQFGKTKVYLEGVFNDLPLNTFEGLIKVEEDYPGKILTFDNEKNAKLAIYKAKNISSLQGFRLLPPTLDDIFKLIISKENNNE